MSTWLGSVGKMLDDADKAARVRGPKQPGSGEGTPPKQQHKDESDALAAEDNVASEDIQPQASDEEVAVSIASESDEKSSLDIVRGEDSSSAKSAEIERMRRRIENLQKENEGLQAIWNEERSNLRKAQELLRTQREKFDARLKSKDGEWLEKVREMESDTQTALSSKTESTDSLRSELLSVRSDYVTATAELELANERSANLKREHESLLRERIAESSRHSRETGELERVFAAERESWQKERGILTEAQSSLEYSATAVRRESDLQSTAVETATALSQTQQRLRSRELESSRLSGQLTWSKQESDKLKQELEANRQMLENTEAMNAQYLADLKRVKQQLSDAKDGMRIAEVQFKHSEEQLQKQIEGLKAKIDSGVSHKRDQLLISQLEQKVRSLKLSLLEKQNELDQATAERKSSKQAADRLRKQVTDLKLSSQSKFGAKHSGLLDLEHGITRPLILGATRNMYQSGRKEAGHLQQHKVFVSGDDLFSKTTNAVLHFFDQSGIRLYSMLRASAWIRLIVVGYLVVVHLWVFLLMISHHNILSAHDAVVSGQPPTVQVNLEADAHSP